MMFCACDNYYYENNKKIYIKNFLLFNQYQSLKNFILNNHKNNIVNIYESIENN